MASTRGRQVVVPLTNKSGGSLAAGDVVIVDTSNDAAVTTTTSARSETSLGVVQETIANNGTGRVLLSGYAALVNVPASVTRGHYIETHTVAKQATGNSTRRSGSFGQFLTGGTTPTAMLWGNTDQTASAGSGVTAGEVLCTSDTTVGNSGFTDINGISQSLSAGTYCIWWKALCVASGGNRTFFGKLWDGSTIYDESEIDVISTFRSDMVGFVANLVLGSTTTVKLSCRSDAGSQTVARDGGQSTAHNPTKMSWIKIA